MKQFFYSTDERYTIPHLTGQMRSAIVQRTFGPLHVRYIFVLSVIHPLLIRQSPLVDHSLSVTYALLMRFMRSLHVPQRPSSPSRRLSSPDEHRINIICIFFCPFGVRYPYPLICDSTIIDISLTLKAATLIFISGRGSAISSAKEG